MAFIHAIGLCLLLLCESFPGSTGSDNVSQILDDLLEHYDKRLRPGFGGPPTQVRVFMNIRSMGPISEENMDYSMDAYFRQVWVDKRLGFNVSTLNVINMDIAVLNRIWKPDTFFHNGRASYIHSVTKPNKLVRISRDGTVLYSIRLTIKATCPMNLQHFPGDRQACPLRIGSYAYTCDEVIYSWLESPINVFRGLTISQFSLSDILISTAAIRNHTGEFSTLGITFNLQRHIGYFLIHIYLPSMLIVVASLVSFWINREAIADRVGLGVTAILTLTTLTLVSRDVMPPLSYATALDWYVLVCFGFIIATLLEVAAVHYFTKVGYGEVEYDPDDEDDDAHNTVFYRNDLFSTWAYGGSSSANANANKNPTYSQSTARLRSRVQGWMTSFRECAMKCMLCLQGSNSYREKMTASKELTDVNSVSIIDKVSRILFPMLFVLFNFAYLLAYWP